MTKIISPLKSNLQGFVWDFDGRFSGYEENIIRKNSIFFFFFFKIILKLFKHIVKVNFFFDFFWIFWGSFFILTWVIFCEKNGFFAKKSTKSKNYNPPIIAEWVTNHKN